MLLWNPSKALFNHLQLVRLAISVIFTFIMIVILVGECRQRCDRRCCAIRSFAGQHHFLQCYAILLQHVHANGAVAGQSAFGQIELESLPPSTSAWNCLLHVHSLPMASEKLSVGETERSQSSFHLLPLYFLSSLWLFAQTLICCLQPATWVLIKHLSIYILNVWCAEIFLLCAHDLVKSLLQVRSLWLLQTHSLGSGLF